MTLPHKISRTLEDTLAKRIHSHKSVHGGCLAQSYKITFSNGDFAFLKCLGSGAKDMFFKEAKALKELGQTKAIRVPQVLAVAENFLALEWIDASRPKKNSHRDFGAALAKLHKMHGEGYGWNEDNYLGLSPQINRGEAKNWAMFYWDKRLRYQFEKLKQKGHLTGGFKDSWKSFENIYFEFMTPHNPPPSLLHGDLWSGNYFFDHRGQAVLFDPALNYGDAECDLAMTRLFGGFPESFYESYHKSIPQTEGFATRTLIYQLYHTLNHANLFSGGYIPQSHSLIDSINRFLA